MAAELTDVVDSSIVIVSWNTCRLLDECLESVRQELACQGDSLNMRARSLSSTTARLMAAWRWYTRVIPM